MKIKCFLTLCLSISLTGCAWLGVEHQKAVEEELDYVYSVWVVPEAKDIKLEKGLNIEDLVSALGQSKQTKTNGNNTILIYPSPYEVRTGITVCLVLIPIPLRVSSDGEYRFYFTNDKLMKITELRTGGGFYGVYHDDSGSGSLSGNKSKCDI